MATGAINPPERRQAGDRREDNSEDEEEDGHDFSLRTRSASAQKNVRGPTKDNDSDFEFDM
jgi:hypothetical protein